jgi:hypothetical protein
MGRRSARFDAVADLEDQSVPIPTSAKQTKRKRTSDDTASEGDDTPEAPQSPPKPKRGRPPAKKQAPENLEVPSIPIPASTKEVKRKRTTDDTASEGDDDTPEALQNLLKPKLGRPPTKKKAPEIVVPNKG